LDLIVTGLKLLNGFRTGRLFGAIGSQHSIAKPINNARAGYRAPTGDGGLAINAGLWSPNGVTVDGAGSLYISEPLRVRKVTTDGIINTIAGIQDPGYSGDGGRATNAQLWNPTGLTVDGAGNVYFADSFNNVIRVLRPVQ
jgi:hypothetical protein